jgi:DNA polymerase-3 subunit beta
VLIPARTLSELARILPEEGTVGMYVTPNRNQVLFRAADELELVSNLIAGQYPNYEAILPTTHTTRVVVKTDELRHAAKAASIFARDTSNIVRLAVAPGEEGGLTPGTITLEATAEDAGDTTTTLDAAVDGPGLDMIFNVKYLTDVLGVMSTPEVSVELSSALKPAVVRPSGDSGYTYVMMPMHRTR